MITKEQAAELQRLTDRAMSTSVEMRRAELANRQAQAELQHYIFNLQSPSPGAKKGKATGKGFPTDYLTVRSYNPVR